jgi:hypothetical protein
MAADKADIVYYDDKPGQAGETAWGGKRDTELAVFFWGGGGGLCLGNRFPDFSFSPVTSFWFTVNDTGFEAKS